MLYWMTSSRRTRWNFALQRAVEHGNALRLPLLVLEPLRAGYRWACDRFHRFVIEGMADNQARLKRKGVGYYPYVEPGDGAGKGLLEALSARAAVVVTDDYPAFFLPRMLRSAAPRLPVRLEAVDSNGLLPMRAAGRTFATAYAFRRFLQRELAGHLAEAPSPDPLAALSLRAPVAIPPAILEQWPSAELRDPAALIAGLPIDHTVGPVALQGGSGAGATRLSSFVDSRLASYATDRNRPDADATSGLSPYLHFGHVSAHEVFAGIAAGEGWTRGDLAEDAKGRRAGWWGMTESSEAFLDQLVTWRELGFNRCLHVEGYDRYEALPAWARKTLAEHASDPREAIYGLDDFEFARTHDPLWNAAQNQLRREGGIHNYLRMLWGKKILEWSESARTALQTMIGLNDKYALDGRDPNSYTGILWVLGLHDRAWGPERPVFGKIRYMSSANTARKYRVRGYVERYSGG
ncbi:MAG: deoxyribodipyrimidine photolyase [Gemmatimonadota bacterium]|nr:deoxyribodipyrimidine photolyase [Gemmatimonadota bacterium]